MDEDELTAVRTRADAATPGPWQATPNLGGVPNGVDICLDPCVIAVVHSDAEPTNLAADTAFIAAARTDVPNLLGVVERLRAKVAAVEAVERGLSEGWVMLATVKDRAEFVRTFRAALDGQEPSDG